jgi:hypothetical protein
MTYDVSQTSPLTLGFSASSLLDGSRAVALVGNTSLVGRGLMGGALLASCLLTWDSVAAQSLSDSEKIERLERQTELLREQLTRQNEQLNRQDDLIRELHQEITQAKKKGERTETRLAKRSEPPLNSNAKESEFAKRSEPSVNTNEQMRPAYVPTEAEIIRGTQPAVPSTLPQFGGIRFSFWGWLEAGAIFRNHNQVNDMLTVFNAIPYPFSPLYKEHEFHGTARQTQLSFLAEGDIDPAQKLSGYLETDFLGIGLESNYLVTNDWAPRLRHGYITYDNDIWGFHLLAGQQWSMMMPNEVGILPRKELIPLTINANYLVGYNFTDNWQIRLVKDFDKKVWLGLSLENPATNLAPGIPDTVNGLAVNVTNTGTGGFLNGVPVTPNQAPDIIEKVAWDPAWGHLEALGMQRFFTDNVLCVTAAPTGCALGTARQRTSFGASVGGNFLVRIVPNYLEVMGGAMYGRGIGRYGAGSLPDVTIAPDGSLTPLTAFHAWSGIQFYPWEGLTLYAYAGLEQNQASYFGTFGYGNPAFDNSGCMTPTAETFATGTSSTCVADNRRLVDVKGGFWQDLYKGPMGRFAVGAELEYIKRTSFGGIGGVVSTDNLVGFTSLRYYF